MNWFTVPTNTKDRNRFAKLSAERQEELRELAYRLYQGPLDYTVARSWKEALNAF